MNVTRRELKKGSKDEYEDVTKEETLNSMIPLWKKIKIRLLEKNIIISIKVNFMIMKIN